MITFYKTTDGAFCCEFTVDESDARFKGMPDMLPEDVAFSIAEFAPSALPGRTYDAEAILGSALHAEHEDAEWIRPALLAVCSHPECPLELVPDSTPGNERFRFRPSLIGESKIGARF